MAFIKLMGIKMAEKWCEIGKWNVGQPHGGSEKYILERNSDTGDFRIKNDFGNIKIDLELMSGVEFLRKVLESMESQIEKDVDEWLKNLDAPNSSFTKLNRKSLIKQTIDFGCD